MHIRKVRQSADSATIKKFHTLFRYVCYEREKQLKTISRDTAQVGLMREETNNSMIKYSGLTGFGSRWYKSVNRFHFPSLSFSFSLCSSQSLGAYYFNSAPPLFMYHKDNVFSCPRASFSVLVLSPYILPSYVPPPPIQNISIEIKLILRRLS